MEFWIKICGNCQKLKPDYEQIPEIFGNKTLFLKMNMFLNLENIKLAESLGVEETPTLKLFCRGREIGQIVGFRSSNDVVNEIKQVFEHEKYC